MKKLYALLALSMSLALGTGIAAVSVDNTKTLIGGVAAPLTLAAGTASGSSAPIITATQTWNNVATTFTGELLNVTDTASAAASLLMDLQVGGASKFSVKKDGSSVSGKYTLDQTYGLQVPSGSGSIAVGTNTPMTWNSTAILVSKIIFDIANQDTSITRKAAKVLEINSGTAGAYPGTALLLGLQTVAQLPAAATAGAGARATVSDATAPTFGATVTGGGAVVTPVYSDGTTWKVG